MTTVHDVLMCKLELGPTAIWPDIWRAHVHKTVAARAMELLDVDRGDVRSAWSSLDDVRSRRKLFTGSKAVWDALTAAIVGRSKWRDLFNDALRARGLRQLNGTQFKVAVHVVVPSLISRPVGRGIVDANPFPAAWPVLANILAAEIHRQTQPAFPIEEWRLLQGLLLVGFFMTCRLPAAEHVAGQFTEHQQVISSLRGAYLRIPEQISEKGVLDRPLTMSARAKTPITLSSHWLSPLVAATEAEANDTFAGQGLMHRMIPIADVGTMPIHMGNISAGKLIAGRHESYLLYEYTVVTFLALASIEYLLRTWAFHRNRTAATGIGIEKPNGQPNGVLDWVVRLGCGVDLLTSINRLYNTDDSNIRNRVLHGNLLEITSRRREMHLAVGDCNRYGWLRQDPDPYHPENIAQHCLACVERIDAEIAGLPLAAADTDWTQAVMLTQAEIDLGYSLSCDFVGPDRDTWGRIATDYLNALTPDLKQLFTIGFIGWLQGNRSTNPTLGMVMGFTFEALYRLTIHLMCSNITGLQGGTLQRSHTGGRSISHFQYRMLDARANGILSARNLDRLVEHVPATDRGTAQMIIQLAVKLRNALAHGALMAADQRTLDAIGNILAKATQTLVTAGLYHFTSEAAYYLFRNEHPRDFTRQDDDWDRASKVIFSRIAAIKHSLRTTYE